MILFVGLGNPGKQYANNRHNVGFMFLDYLLQKMNPSTPFKQEKSFLCEAAQFTHDNDKYVFVKPQTFMNLSGDSVQKVAHYYKITPNNIYVAHDDLDILLGKFKINPSRGPKLHNGLDSIEEKLGTQEFWRVRIGVDARTPETHIPGEDYVLQNFTYSEKTELNSIFEQIYKQLLLQKVI